MGRFDWFFALGKKVRSLKRPKVDLAKKNKELREGAKKFKKFLMTYDFIHFLAFRKQNLKEFKRMRLENSAAAAENLIRGLGGEKNLLDVRNSVYGLRITFKSDYLIDREAIDRSGGLDIRIWDKSLSSVFDRQETKWIARRIKQRIKDSRRRNRPLDVD